MSTTYSVIFKSGAVEEFRYENEGNIDYVNITNTDQTYYQTAEIGLHDLGNNSLDINDKIRVVIDDKIQFDGYANRV